MPRRWREELAGRLETDLARHVVQAWFPRSVDRKHGGFLCDFDVRWRPAGAQQRMLEFQARQARTAARLGTAYPQDPRWVDIALHGLRYLRDVMFDRELGGWFWMVDSSGTPLGQATKHAHGTAYVLDAGVEIYRLTGEREALDLARMAFEWLEANTHDPVAGGYFGWTTRQGRPITDPQAAVQAGHAGRDPLGHGPGLKDANVHSDILEAFTLLLEFWPEPLVRDRLSEVYELLTKRFATPAGSMHYLAYADFTPVPGVERYGYPLQTASRLPAAAAVIDVTRQSALEVARSLVDHATAQAWDDRRGGMIEAGPAVEPYVLSGTPLRVNLRPWWVQIEAMTAHLLLGLIDGAASRHLAQFERQLAVVDRQFVDQRFGGWYAAARSGSPGLLSRLGRGVSKGNVWKDASHEADFYLTAIRMLRGLPAAAPIDTALGAT